MNLPIGTPCLCPTYSITECLVRAEGIEGSRPTGRLIPRAEPAREGGGMSISIRMIAADTWMEGKGTLLSEKAFLQPVRL